MIKRFNMLYHDQTAYVKNGLIYIEDHDQTTPTSLTPNVTSLNNFLTNSNFRKSTVGLEDYII
jgi:hypothetical protein